MLMVSLKLNTSMLKVAKASVAPQERVEMPVGDWGKVRASVVPLERVELPVLDLVQVRGCALPWGLLGPPVGD
jgi:hypothetical protein